MDTDGKNWMGDVDLYCATPEQQQDAARQLRKQLDACAPLAGRQLAFKDRHEAVAPGVYRVTYSDGYQVYVNLTETDFVCDGFTVPALDLIQVKV